MSAPAVDPLKHRTWLLAAAVVYTETKDTAEAVAVVAELAELVWAELEGGA